MENITLTRGKFEIIEISTRDYKETLTIPKKAQRSHSKERITTKWNRFINSLDESKTYTVYTTYCPNPQYCKITGKQFKEFKRCKGLNSHYINQEGILLHIDGYSIYLQKLMHDRPQKNGHFYYSTSEGKFDPDRLVIGTFGGNVTSEALHSSKTHLHHVGANGYRDFTSTSLLTVPQHTQLHRLEVAKSNDVPDIKAEVKKIAKMGNISPKIIHIGADGSRNMEEFPFEPTPQLFKALCSIANAVHLRFLD